MSDRSPVCVLEPVILYRDRWESWCTRIPAYAIGKDLLAERELAEELNLPHVQHLLDLEVWSNPLHVRVLEGSGYLVPSHAQDARKTYVIFELEVFLLLHGILDEAGRRKAEHVERLRRSPLLEGLGSYRDAILDQFPYGILFGGDADDRAGKQQPLIQSLQGQSLGVLIPGYPGDP